MKQRQCVRSITVSMVFTILAIAGHAETKTWTAATGDWFDDANWTGGDGTHPKAGDDAVVANNGASVLLTNSTAYLGSFVVSNAMLVFSNWNTTLSATDVAIQNGGYVTTSCAFTNNAMSNNVCILCSNLTIDAGGSINVDARGYSGGTNSGGAASRMIGSGPGYGGKVDYDFGGGGAYGGWAYRSSYPGGMPYGMASNPVAPGSGGCSGYSASGNHNGGAGGGAVRIEASGDVTVNGTISANGGNGGADWVGGGGGSGGGILIRCLRLLGSSGVVRANGGSTLYTASGAGAGGRIAVHYDVAAQNALATKPTVAFTVLPGTSGLQADVGTLYFPDTYFLSETIGTSVAGQIAGLPAWGPESLTISNTWIRFPEDGFQLTVTNSLTVTGGGGKLDMGGGTLLTSRNRYVLTGGALAPALNVGGDLVLTNGGALTVYAAATNPAVSICGAEVNVTNALRVFGGSWVYPVSHFFNGGSVRFRVGGLAVESSAGFNADSRGFAGGEGYAASGYGPGKGTGHGSWYSGGGGYGGSGGRSVPLSSGANGVAGGVVNGSAASPAGPGSGGGAGNGTAGAGGGAIWIEAAGDVRVNGTLTANGQLGGFYVAGGGSGGGIYIACRTIAGANGVIRANGGGGGYTTPPSSSGGGGGGRIAIAYDCAAQSNAPLPSLSFSCAPGAGYVTEYEGGDIGTLWLPDNQFLSESIPHSVQWIVPGFTSWAPSALTVSGWIRFPFDEFTLDVANGVTVAGSAATGNKLEVTRLTCGSVVLTNASLIIKGNTTVPALTCAGGLTVTNGMLVLDGSGGTGTGSVSCSNDLALLKGSTFYVYSSKTNSAEQVVGARVTVGGDFLVANGSTIYPCSQSVNGASPRFEVGSLTLSGGASFNANERGFTGIVYGNGYGPGGGIKVGELKAGGGGYGGRGGLAGEAYPDSYGPAYGSSNAPVYPGSGGGSGYYSTGGRGGGLIWVVAAGTMTLDGTLAANGGSGVGQHNAGGSGGGIYLICTRLAGSGAVFSAKGGDGKAAGTEGGGGGGRIAVWRMRGVDPGTFAYNVANGVGTYSPDYAQPGTVHFGQFPLPGTLLMLR